MAFTVDEIEHLSLEDAQVLLGNSLLEINKLRLDNAKLHRKVEKLKSELSFVYSKASLPASNIKNNSIKELLDSNQKMLKTGDHILDIANILKKK